jgi:mono/diheme cytochrome c family protein
MSVLLSRARLLSCAALLVALTIPDSSQAQASKPTGTRTITGKTVAATVVPSNAFYTAAQAARGEKVFAAQCVTCHARKDLSNPDFKLKWNGRTVFDLFERLQSTMPESDPGSLSDAEYADVVAYLMKLNGMPAGKVVVAPGPALKKQKLAMVTAR